MFTYPRLKIFSVMLGFVLASATHDAFSASAKEPTLEKLIIPLSSEIQLTFTMPMKSRIDFFLMTEKSTNTDQSSTGQITISDQDCALGHQVSISYEKKSQEILTAYFPKEIPWNTTYKLSVSRDAKTLTVNLNGETISVRPSQKTKFIYLIKNPEIINILGIEQH